MDLVDLGDLVQKMEHAYFLVFTTRYIGQGKCLINDDLYTHLKYLKSYKSCRYQFVNLSALNGRMVAIMRRRKKRERQRRGVVTMLCITSR